jgi:Protein of unknown function DUF262
MTQNSNDNRATPAPSEEDIERWIDAEESESLAPVDELSTDVERKYAETQLRVVRSTMDYSLHTLKTTLADRTYINMSPSYQRRNRWDTRKRSQLIESFLMNIPVPPLFLFENDYNQYEVMDGRQRLEAISDYLDGKFALTGLEFWKELEGMRFSDLPPVIRRGLLRRTVSAVVLLAETSRQTSVMDVRMVLFRRLNTGGVKLNPQELRNALYPGHFQEMLLQLARSDDFTRLWGIPHKTVREDDDGPSPALVKNALYRTMTDCELVLRFFAIRETVQRDLKGSLRRILDRCMAEHQFDTYDQIRSAEQLFLRTLQYLDDCLNGNPFELPETGRLSRPLYDAMMVAASLYGPASPDAADIQARLQDALTNRDNFDILVGRGNTVDAIHDRVNTAKWILTGER